MCILEGRNCTFSVAGEKLCTSRLRSNYRVQLILITFLVP